MMSNKEKPVNGVITCPECNTDNIVSIDDLFEGSVYCYCCKEEVDIMTDKHSVFSVIDNILSNNKGFRKRSELEQLKYQMRKMKNITTKILSKVINEKDN